MMKDIDDFWTCHPRGTELEELWKAHLTSEDAFVPEVRCGDKYGHAFSPNQEKPLIMWGRPPSPSDSSSHLRDYLCSRMPHLQHFLLRVRIARIPHLVPGIPAPPCDNCFYVFSWVTNRINSQ